MRAAKGIKKYLYIGAAFIISLLIIILVLLSLKRRPPVEWTRVNSLAPINHPVLNDHGDTEPLLTALDKSLAFLDKPDAPEEFIFGPDRYSREQVRDSFLDFKSKLEQWGLSASLFDYLKEHYHFYRSAADSILFTGYYEARLKGSRVQTERYAHPLYRKPADLVRVDLSQFYFFEKYKGLPRILRGRLENGNRVVPFYDRQEIDSGGVLSGKGLEMVWVDDPIDLFFLQIQGSGIVELENGDLLRVNYTAGNGHPYRAIGRLLLEQKALDRDNVSMQSIRAYLEKHPEEMDEIFNYNPSYVFFREVKEGPIGAIGFPVTPYRSIATDLYLFPPAALCFIETEIPVFDKNGNPEGQKPLQGFVLNQDTGGAIRGPGRVDLFTGFGDNSELVAGHLKQNGSLYFLVKKRE